MIREDIDAFVSEAQEAAIRAQFGRLSGPAAIGLAADCIDSSVALIDAGKLISEGGPDIPQRHRGDHPEPRRAGLRPRAEAFGSDARNLREVPPALDSHQATPPPKSQEQLEAERQEVSRRFEGAAMRQQGIYVSPTAAEERELAQAQAAARLSERARRDEQERRARAFKEEQLQQMGWGSSQADEAARNEDLGRREALARGLTIEEP